jgi:hypothetical protein
MSYAAGKELAYRNQNGLEVRLLWYPRSNEVSVEVIDQLDASGFRLPIAGHLALDASVVRLITTSPNRRWEEQRR